jgi:hypothetical protein
VFPAGWDEDIPIYAAFAFHHLVVIVVVVVVVVAAAAT